MISQIDMENFALFAKSRIAFEGGLNVLTGESGSGKSLALESIATLFGARLTAERIGAWGEQLRIRAVLELAPDDPRWGPLAALGVEPDAVLIVERLSGRDGRTVYRAQGELVPAQAIRALGDTLLQYVGQNQLLKAATAQFVLDWVDRFGQLEGLAQETRAAYGEWRERDAAVNRLEALAQDLSRLEEKRALQDELKGLNIRADEDVALQQELARLRAGRVLIETSQALYQRIEGSDAEEGVMVGLNELQRLAETLAHYDARLGNMTQAIRDALQIIGDVRLEISTWKDSLDLDPRRLEELEARADVLSRVKRRFGPELSDVLGYLESLRGDIERLDNLDWEMAQLVKQRDLAYEGLRTAGEKLSQARGAVLERAGQELTACIRELEMPSGRIAVERREQPVSERGSDLLEIYFSANEGQAMKPLAKVASGGELARVALALAVTGETQGEVIYIFDEVDQGLGGASAERVGWLLKQLGSRAQVIAVSHQPVVAARADRHVRVQKVLESGRSRSTATVVEGKERAAEVARMLSGSQDGIALKHAEALLANDPGGLS